MNHNLFLHDTGFILSSLVLKILILVANLFMLMFSDVIYANDC